MLVCTLVRDRCTPAIDALTTPVLKCIGLFRCLPCRFGFPSWCLMVSRSKAFALLCAIAPPNADCIGGVCGLLLLQVVVNCRPLPLEWGGDVSETMEPPNTTPGRFADLDLLEVDFLTKWRTRLFVVWCSCRFAPWCEIDAPLLLIHSPHRC